LEISLLVLDFQNGNSALHYAASYGRRNLVSYFIESGVDIELHNEVN